MQKETIVIDVKTEAGRQQLQKLKGGIQDVKTETKKASGAMDAFGGTADKLTGGAISKFKGLKTALGGTIKQLGLVRVAVIGTGIGALVIAVTSLIQAFKASEEGQDRFAKIMGQIGVVVGNVKDIVAEFGEGLFALGGALKKVLSGDIKGALKEAGGAFDGFSEKVKNFKQETLTELGVADEIADKIAKVNKQERALQVERAQANRRIAELREKAADKENVAIAERIAALEEAGRIEAEINEKEVAAAQIRLEVKQQQNSLSKSTKEDLDEEAALQARVIELETGRLKLQKALTAEVTTARREATSEAKAIQAEEDKAEKDRKDAIAAEDKQRAETALAEKKKREEDEAKRQSDIKAIEDSLRIAEEDAAAETELQKIELEKQRTLQRLDFLKATEEERAAIVASFDKKILDQKEKDNQQELRQKELIEQQKLAVVGNTLGAVSELLGKNSAAGKAAAIAQATINTYQGITQVLKNETTLPEPFGTIQKIASAGTVLASGLKAVKSIQSQQLPAIKGARGGSNSSAAAPSLAAPSFNIVGQGGTNQLAETISRQTKEPVKAYVVSSDVSTAQSMERNIISGATI